MCLVLASKISNVSSSVNLQLLSLKHWYVLQKLYIMMGVIQGMIYTPGPKAKLIKPNYIMNAPSPPPKVDHGCDVEMKPT